MSKSIAGLVLGLALAVTGPVAPLVAQDTARAQALAAPLLDDHPLALFQSAVQVFGDGRRAEGVYLFYLAQLRWRRYMDARPDLPPDQDRALYASMHDVFGRPINEWAFGDIEWLVATLRDLDTYDATTPDLVTPVQDYPEVHARSRAGFADFIAMIEAQADDIRAERMQNGLENR